MTPDQERIADKWIAKLRRLKKLDCLSAKEAQSEYDSAPEKPLSPDRIKTIVTSVTFGEPPCNPLPIYEPNAAFGNIDNEVLELFRNKGESEDDDETEDALRKELLNDEQPPEDET